MSTQSLDVADPGLYGPDSVTWRVHADPSMALAGLRALLLQAVHPLAMSGVAQHSDFREDPWGRLFRTAEYVGVTTFGTTEHARRAGAKVRGIHRRLGGIEPESGIGYRVNDPELLRWVQGRMQVLAFEQGRVELPKPAVIQRICAVRRGVEDCRLDLPE